MRIVVALGLLALLVVGGAVWAVTSLDAEALGREALEHLNRREGVDLRAESFHLGLFDGLEMRNAEGSLRFSDATMDVALGSLTLEPELLPLLRRRLVIREAVLDAPELRLISDRPGAAGPKRESRREARRRRREERRAQKQEDDGVPAAAAPVAAAVAVEVRSLRLIEGALTLVDAAGGVTEIRGLELELRDLEIEDEEALAGVRGRGSLRAAEVASGGITATGLSSGLEAGDGRLRFTDVAFDTPSAQVRGASLSADLTRVPYAYELAADGDMDLDIFLAGEAGGAAGPARLRLDVQGEGPDAGQVRGSGLVTLERGSFPAPPLIRQIESIAGDLLTGRSYEETEIPFSVDGEVIEVGTFELLSEEIGLGGEGRIDLTGPVSMTLRLKAPREGIQADGLGSEVLDALTGDDGRVTLPLRVGGTLESPRVEPDLEILGDRVLDKAREAAEEELGKLGRDLLDKLLDRDE